MELESLNSSATESGTAEENPEPGNDGRNNEPSFSVDLSGADIDKLSWNLPLHRSVTWKGEGLRYRDLALKKEYLAIWRAGMAEPKIDALN